MPMWSVFTLPSYRIIKIIYLLSQVHSEHKVWNFIQSMKLKTGGDSYWKGQKWPQNVVRVGEHETSPKY